MFLDIQSTVCLGFGSHHSVLSLLCQYYALGVLAVCYCTSENAEKCLSNLETPSAWTFRWNCAFRVFRLLSVYSCESFTGFCFK